MACDVAGATPRDAESRKSPQIGAEGRQRVVLRRSDGLLSVADRFVAGHPDPSAASWGLSSPSPVTGRSVHAHPAQGRFCIPSRGQPIKEAGISQPWTRAACQRYAETWVLCRTSTMNSAWVV